MKPGVMLRQEKRGIEYLHLKEELTPDRLDKRSHTLQKMKYCFSINQPVLLIVFLLLSHAGKSQVSGSISGNIINKKTQQPLGNANVTLIGSSMGGISDSAGRFIIAGIALKTYNIEFSMIGFKNQTVYNIVVNSGNENSLSIELEPADNELNEVVIKSNKRTVKTATLETPLSVQRLTTEEIKSSPGGNFDIGKVIQTLPGVGGGQQGGSFRNDIIIRGGAPNENVYYLDGIEIPVLNHFQTQGSSGGPQGMLNVSFIEDVKLSSSAFDARYDNALSSVFQFKQKNGNPNKIQGNLRLSATELAATLEGPLAKNKKTTFLFSARRSYLELLFTALDLPIRPNYWDFQTKITSQLSKKTSFSFIGIGAIDKFSFATVKNATPEKQYALNSNISTNQWNATFGFTLKTLVKNGFINIAASRNSFDNDLEQYEDNTLQLPAQQTLSLQSRETENKLRIDVTKNINEFKLSYGAVAQFAEYHNNTFSVIRREIKDNNGNVVQPSITVNFKTPLHSFWRYGAFAQIGKRLFSNRLGISAGLRSDLNSFTSSGNEWLETLSPRLSLSFVVTNKLSLSGSVGRYYKIPPYTILGFADNNGILVNKRSKYLQSDHYVAGVEYLPDDGLRFTIEGFYKKYAQVPVSVNDGISLSNLGADFNALGNQAVNTDGKGRAYGVEFFAQKKLTRRFFGILSYTWYRSKYSGNNGILLPSSWDNQHLVSITWGYKFPKNWELGLKFRYQGGAPYTPYDEPASKLNYLSLGQGILDYASLNSQRLRAFNSSDVRIDKKWNFRKITLDLFLDVSNWYVARNQASPAYTFKRTADNKRFLTTDGQTINADGSNAVPTYINFDDPSVLPTLGVIVEF